MKPSDYFSNAIIALQSLSAKEAAFVMEYIKSENRTQAAIAAGYAPKSAHATGSKILKRYRVEAAIVADKLKALDRSASIRGVSQHLFIGGKFLRTVLGDP